MLSFHQEHYIAPGKAWREGVCLSTDTKPAQYLEHVYVLTKDTTFQAGKTYYTESDGVYSSATVTEGEAVTPGTYYEYVYEPTHDAVFSGDKTYYKKSGNSYNSASVTAGQAVCLTESMANGSRLIEIDDSKVFHYNASADTWVEWEAASNA